MIVKKTSEVPSFQAGDETQIKEILHPKNDGLELSYSLAHATLRPGEKSLPHILQERSEVYYLLSGTGRININGEEKDLVVGDLVFIPAGAEQWITNIGEDILQFLCIVSPPWSAEDEEVKPGE